ncbi:hypothetical protein EMCRGX_G009149 [Ephydatia muelleri]
MWRELGVRNSYTMEATFCGSRWGSRVDTTSTRQTWRPWDDTSVTHSSSTVTLTEPRWACPVGVSRGRVPWACPSGDTMQQVLREVEEDYRKEVVERLVAMGRAVPKGVDPLDIVLEPEESRCFGGGVWK